MQHLPPILCQDRQLPKANCVMLSTLEKSNHQLVVHLSEYRSSIPEIYLWGFQRYIQPPFGRLLIQIEGIVFEYSSFGQSNNKVVEQHDCLVIPSGRMAGCCCKNPSPVIDRDVESPWCMGALETEMTLSKPVFNLLKYNMSCIARADTARKSST